MTRSRWVTRLALLIAAVALVASCGKDTPTGGGGGGTRELDSPHIANSGTYSHLFANTGSYPYHCDLHSGMNGSVHVEAGHPMTAAVTITDNQFTPTTALVAPGGTVTWTNNGSTHTVTSD